MTSLSLVMREETERLERRERVLDLASLASAKARLVAHLRRGAGSSDLLAYADLRVDPLRRRAWKSDSPLALSAREFDLLVGLMREQGRVFRKSQLLESVWGVDAEVGTETVDRFVSLLRAKLEADGSPRLVQTVRGVGYTLRIEEKIG